MKHCSAVLAFLAFAIAPMTVPAASFSLAAPGIAPSEIIEVAQSWSCTPRKTCGRIGSCDEAYWYLRNCSWGGRLDGDSDGIPCESICG